MVRGTGGKDMRSGPVTHRCVGPRQDSRFVWDPDVITTPPLNL